MSYSRDYLRELPIKMRKQFLEQTIQPYVQQILGAAQNGKSSVMISDQTHKKGAMICNMAPWQKPPTMEELREALLEKFPDCTITYEEKWVDIAPGRRELKTGITVDWS